MGGEKIMESNECYHLADTLKYHVGELGEGEGEEFAKLLIRQAIEQAGSADPLADPLRAAHRLYFAAVKLLAASAITMAIAVKEGWEYDTDELPTTYNEDFNRTLFVLLDDGRSYYASFPPGGGNDEIDIWLRDSENGCWRCENTIGDKEVFMWRFVRGDEVVDLQKSVRDSHDDDDDDDDDD